MFRKSKIKIVATIMVILIILLSGILFMIYFSSYVSVFNKNKEMLYRYADAYWQNGNPKDRQEAPPPDVEDNSREERIYKLSTFYSVELSDSGDVISINNDGQTGITDEFLTQFSQSLAQSGKNYGIKDGLIYCVEENDDITLVVLMDIIIMSDNMRTLFINTILFGSVGIILLLFPAFYFAHRIVKPLEDNYKKQKQFISDASHELKTPIAVIGTNIEMLERELGSGKWSTNIKYETKQMGRMVEQLLNLARTENNLPELKKINFSRVVTGSVLPFECMAFEKDIELDIKIQDNIQISGNEEQLSNLISILLDNAIEYSPAHSIVDISLQTNRHTAQLTVSNQGEEIPESKRKAIFDRFYRLDLARNQSTGHYGLGLSIAKAIVTIHNGRIWVESNQQLVVFCVAFPLSS